MFSTVLKEITGYLDRRFVFTLFYPSLLFWAGLLAVYVLNGDPGAIWTDWDQQTFATKIVQIVVVLAGITFFAHMLANQLTWLTRQFEGYWDWLPFNIGKRLRRWRGNYYAKVLKTFDEQDDRGGYERIYYGYPLPTETEQLMPTRLGNILKNAELYPYQRYQMDAVLMWPRLYAILPKEYASSLGDAKASLDLMLVTSALSNLFAVVTGSYLFIVGGAWWLFLACFPGGLILARLAYMSALQAAIPYAQLIKSAFDLYRRDLLDKLGFEHPKSLDAEVKLWDNLCKLVYRNAPEDASLLRYHDAADEQKKQVSTSTDQEPPWPISLVKYFLGRLIGKSGSS